MARRFHVELIKPSHCDDDGYVIQWIRSLIPYVHGMLANCSASHVMTFGIIA
jgi:hypothetical protein